MAFFGFGPAADVKIEFKGQEKQPTVQMRDEEGHSQRFFVFTNKETVAGKVTVKMPSGKKLEHLGIKIEVVGQIEMLHDRGNPYEFTSLVRDLSGPGEITENKTWDFEFEGMEKPYETYVGTNVYLRYFVRVKISRSYSSNIVKTLDFAVQNVGKKPEGNDSIKMEVGIEDCLHIEFEYNKSKYHLMDVVIGKIYFLLVRIKIKHMEIVIIKRESTGSGAGAYHESENIAKYEIMDGAPVRGESIPVRLFLKPYKLTPTFKNVSNKFSVKYYLNLVLIDEEDRRYFKQQEVTLWRQALTTEKPKKSLKSAPEESKSKSK